MNLRILLVDDHEIMLDGLRSVLGKQAGMEVVGEARDGREAVSAARELKPSLVVMDVSMPGLNGVEATRQIVAAQPGVKILCLSMHSDPVLVEAVLEAGAAGYQLKDYALAELMRAIGIVMANETYLCPRVAGGVVQTMLKARRPGADSPVFAQLTGREREILQLIAEGHTNKEIAARLHLSVKTVGTHREHLMQKLDIHSIAGLTKYAVRQGLTSDEP